MARLSKPEKDDEYYTRAFSVHGFEDFDEGFLGGQAINIEMPEFEVRAKTALAIGAIESAQYFAEHLERVTTIPEHAEFAIHGLHLHRSEEASKALRTLINPNKPQDWAAGAVEHIGENGGFEMIQQVEAWLADPACKLPRENLTNARARLRERFKQ